MITRHSTKAAMECLSVCCELWNPKKNIRSLCCRSSTRFAVVDTMRAASSILLVLFHTYFIGTSVLNFDSGMEKLNFHAWGSYMTNAHHCVDGFLVVSGFCICYFIVKEQHSRNAQLKWFAFMFRRLMRVTPGLIAALLINRTVMAIFGGGNKNCVDYWWRDVLYINNLYPIQDMCVDYTWSLGLEVQFYVFCATLLALLWRWPWAQKLAAWLVVLGSVAFRWYIIVAYDLKYPPNIDEWKVEDERAGWGNLIYTKPQSRMGGIFCGVLMSLYYCERCEPWFLIDGVPRGKIAAKNKLNDNDANVAMTDAEYLDGRSRGSWARRLCVFLAFAFMLIHMFAPWPQLIDEPCFIKGARWPEGHLRYSYKCPEVMPRWLGVPHFATFRILFSGALSYLGYEWLVWRHEASEQQQRSWLGRTLVFVIENPLWYVLAQLSFGVYLLNPYGVGIAFLYILPDFNVHNRTEDPWWICLANVVALLTTFSMAVPLFLLVESPGINASNLVREERAGAEKTKGYNPLPKSEAAEERELTGPNCDSAVCYV